MGRIITLAVCARGVNETRRQSTRRNDDDALLTGAPRDDAGAAKRAGTPGAAGHARNGRRGRQADAPGETEAAGRVARAAGRPHRRRSDGGDRRCADRGSPARPFSVRRYSNADGRGRAPARWTERRAAPLELASGYRCRAALSVCCVGCAVVLCAACAAAVCVRARDASSRPAAHRRATRAHLAAHQRRAVQAASRWHRATQKASAWRRRRRETSFGVGSGGGLIEA